MCLSGIWVLFAVVGVIVLALTATALFALIVNTVSMKMGRGKVF